MSPSGDDIFDFKHIPIFHNYTVVCQQVHSLKWYFPPILHTYEGWNFNSGNYLFTTDTK